MKVAVSVPDDVFSRADELAAELGVSRSQIYTRALEEYLEQHGAEDDPVSAQVNKVVDSTDTDSAFATMAARRLIDSGHYWEW
ncbi:MAG: ribbon-helix-helix domain-containing protein [Pseudonocardia sp.]|nr:ribbon-helix-helix domain-containing protein [Pseudonocardia sp.]